MADHKKRGVWLHWPYDPLDGRYRLDKIAWLYQDYAMPRRHMKSALFPEKPQAQTPKNLHQLAYELQIRGLRCSKTASLNEK